MNFSQYAELRGCSVQAVCKAIDSGRLKKCLVTVPGAKKQKINPIIAQEEWALNTDTSYISNGKSAPPPVAMSFDDLKAHEPPPAPLPNPLNKKKAKGENKNEETSRSIKEFYAAKMAQLEYEREAGLLIPAAQVQSESFKLARMVRDRIMAIPARLSAELVGHTDQKVIAKKLVDELRRALDTLAEDAAALPPPADETMAEKALSHV